MWLSMTSIWNKNGAVLRILCAVLIVFLGFSHKPMVARAAGPSDLVFWALPDGSVPSLCLPGEDGKPQGKHVDMGCEACRIASATTLPPPPDTHEEIARFDVAVPFVVAAERFHHHNFPPNAPPRGPPAILFSFEAA